MVFVQVYCDGQYKITEVDDDHQEQFVYGVDEKGYKGYYCKKEDIKTYLLMLITSYMTDYELRIQEYTTEWGKMKDLKDKLLKGI